ncbi:hypothetical protein [Bradyrhizobium sp. B117]|uniref:hypothetical protein n=1 Tax=Bradyrhizobium sp. B117 TaxID=3140246 RepID=UPI0031831605
MNMPHRCIPADNLCRPFNPFADLNPMICVFMHLAFEHVAQAAVSAIAAVGSNKFRIDRGVRPA